VECESDNECSYSDTCFKNQCVSPCVLEKRCAINAECRGENHRASCRCSPGYVGNAELLCERPECSSDYDCPSSLACRGSRCIEPCAADSPCARNAICRVANHVAICRCPEAEPLGDPYSFCKRKPVETTGRPECAKDAECPSRLACLDGSCQEPCAIIRPCFEGARCSVLDTVPVRTMVCTCPSGWITDSEGICRPSKSLDKLPWKAISRIAAQ
jgi:hypothetical protein